MRKYPLIIAILLVTWCPGLSGQGSFFDPGKVEEIRVHFDVPDWKAALDTLFVQQGDEGRLTGDVTISGTTLKNAGVRYKGYSSWNLDEVKNPFNIELDYLMPDRNYQGYTKIKLSNVIHDPSFVREVLAYEIARKYMPASQAGYANLYINDTLIGLYTNVEPVDNNFIGSHFSSGGNCFFKGEPDTLRFPFGENANLDYAHGTDSSGYRKYYKMESEYGWNDLVELKRVLCEDSLNLEKVLNVDQALWMHAFNYTVMNLDSYIAYAQNYYMYKDDNGRFNPVIWDLNMSFGSFRESDGSKNFLGVSIPKMKTLDPLEHLTFSITPRPLMTNLFKNDRYKRIYLAHMRTIVKENFVNGFYYSRGKELQEIIRASVLNDTNKFYSYEDFLLNLDTIVGGTGSMIKYPGIRDIIEARIVYLQDYPGFTGEPSVTGITHFPEHPGQGEETQITARITGAGYACLGYRFTGNGVFSKTRMFDDGSHGDGAAGDSVFGATLPAAGKIIQYYIYAENDSAGVFSPERAETEYYFIQPVINPGDVVINEIMAGTSTGWIELLNTTAEDLSMEGCKLTDDLSLPAKWSFPDTLIRSRSYLLLGTGCLHPDTILCTDVSAEQAGGSLLLSATGGSPLDSVVYGPMVSGKTAGRYPNGYGTFTYMPPSPSQYNRIGTTPGTGILIYPNPAKTVVNFELKNVSQPVSVRIYDMTGKLILTRDYLFPKEMIPVVTEPINLAGFSNGIYFLQVICKNMTETGKFAVE